MANVHPSSVIGANAQVAADATIGPFCFVEDGATIGPACVLESHVTVKGGVTMGANNVIGQGSVIGGDPQDRKYKGEPTFVQIGDDNRIREYVTIHRATGEGTTTTVGSRNYLMAFVHLGHNTTLGSDITIANNVGLSGHCTVEDFVTLGGMAGVHQFVRIGRLSMVAGLSRITRDVPPFMLVEGFGGEQKVCDINAVGLRRSGITQDGRLALHKAGKLLFKSQLGLTKAIEITRREVPSSPEVEELIAFMERLFQGKNGRGDQR